MFKIESYITPLLMGYVDKYVKLRPEDFQLSLWGGDAVLNNLDLRLDAIEQTINLPISFKSGHIHELHLHVPWTRLGSEPIVITINTIECIVRLRDGTWDSDKKSSKSSGSSRSASQVVRIKAKKQQVEDELPPGYIQSLVNKVINNVSIIVNNLILKFVEDDIVLSVNVKSAECYSVSPGWNRTFVEVTPAELILRKVINFCDLTVCLDKCDSSGRIETYQDPLLYRCSLSCRMHMTYETTHSKLPLVTKVNVLCEKLDVSLTDTQLPLFLRLVELCLALYYGILDVPDDEDDNKTEPDSQEVNRQSLGQEESSNIEAEDDQGWANWAWSFVPQILPEDYEDEEEDETFSRPKKKSPPPILCLGLYISNASLMLKLTETVREAVHFGPNRVSFRPFLFVEAGGLAVDIFLHGRNYLDVQFGMTHISVSSQGRCACDAKEPEDVRDQVLAKGGESMENGDKPLSYLTNSLFDIACPENVRQPTSFITDTDKHNQVYTEQYGMQKFGIFWFDYLYTIMEPENKRSSKSSSSGEANSADEMQDTRESAVLRFVIGPLEVNVSSSFVHRVEKIIHCAMDHQYEAYSIPKDESVNENCPLPTADQVKLLEEYVSTRNYNLTILQPKIYLLAAEHLQRNVKKKHHTSRTDRSNTKRSTESASSQYVLPAILLSAVRFDIQFSQAMYPQHVVQLVSKLAGPSSQLMHHCYTHMQVKLYSFSAGLLHIEPAGTCSHSVTIVPPCSGALYKRTLLFPIYWKNPFLASTEYMFEIPQLSINLKKAHILFVFHIWKSWLEKKPRPLAALDDTLLDDISSDKGSESAESFPLFELTLNNFEMRSCFTPSAIAFTGTLSSIQAVLYVNRNGKDQVIPILSGPSPTTAVTSSTFFISDAQPTLSSPQPADFVTFTIQLPNKTDTPEAPALLQMNVSGLAVLSDPAIYAWLSYMPRKKVNPKLRQQQQQQQQQQVDKVTVDPNLAHVASPLAGNLSQVSVPSSNSTRHQTTMTGPSHSVTQTQSMSQQPKDAAATVDQGNTTGQDTNENFLGNTIARWFPLLRIMKIQIEVQPWLVFLSLKSMQQTEPNMDVPSNLRELFKAGLSSDILVLCLPHIIVHSAGIRSSPIIQDIPVRILEGSLVEIDVLIEGVSYVDMGDKLPWTITVSNYSIYSLHPSQKAFSLVKPGSVSCTLAVSTKYHPPASDNVSSLALCLHLDMHTMRFSCSLKQIQLCVQILNQLIVEGSKLSSLAIPKPSVPVVITPIEPSSVKPGQKDQQLVTQSVLSQSNTQGQTHSTSFSNDMDITGLTETSGEFSREATPIRDQNMEDDPELEGVKLSLWLQWTCPKCEIKLYGCDPVKEEESQICCVLEELATSVDVQEIYIKAKANIGTVCITHHQRSFQKDQWMLGPYKGILLSCVPDLAHNTQIITPRLWSSSDSNLNTTGMHFFSTAADIPREKRHGFLSITFTRALCKNVKRKLRKLNVELIGLHDTDASNIGENLYFHKYISEVCLSMEPCDLVVYLPAIKSVFNMADLATLFSAVNKLTNTSPVKSEAFQAPPIPTYRLTTSTLPLMFVNLSCMRVFIPTGETSSGGHLRSGNVSTTLDHDMFLLQFFSLALTPQADNPLPRYAVRKHLFAHALQAGITHQPGSAIEDRQYQFDIKGLSLSSGCWHSFVKNRSKMGGLSDLVLPSVQIPALEWNTLQCPAQQDQEDIKLIPIAYNFNLKIVVAPPVVYSRPEESEQKGQVDLLVCGAALEVNVTSDMDFFVSINQVLLLQQVLQKNIACFFDTDNDGESSQASETVDKTSGTHLETPQVADSGLGSEISATINYKIMGNRGPKLPCQNTGPSISNSTSLCSKDVVSSTAVSIPLEILLTAGRISCMFYTHTYNVPQSATPAVVALVPPPPPTPKSPVSSEHLPSPGAVPFNLLNMGYKEQGQIYVGSDCSTERLSTSDAGSDKFSSLDLNQIPHIVPYLYLYFSQPHTVVTVQPETQKFEMSYYDVMVKGPPSGYTLPVEEYKLLPEYADFNEYWIETRAGQPHPKTGVPPSFFTLRISDFLNKPARVSLQMERPLKLNVSPDKLCLTQEIVQQIQQSLGCSATNSANAQESASNEKTGKSSKDKTMAVLSHLSWMNRFCLKTEQVVVLLEAKQTERSPGIMTSLTSINMEVTLHQNEVGLVNEIVSSLSLKDLQLKTCYLKQTPLAFIGPSTLNFTMASQWCTHSGPDYLPKSVLTLETGLLLVHFGQEHLLCLNHFTEQFFKECEGLFGSSQTGDSENKSPPTAETPDYQGEFIALSSTDDLRTGRFRYIMEPEMTENNACPNQIVFCNCNSNRNSTMTWCYEQARVLSHVTISPVPFSLPQEEQFPKEQPSKIPCTLQYWDSLMNQFIEYVTFTLSENESSSLSLPEVKPLNTSDLTAAQMWRVVIHQKYSDFENSLPSTPSGSETDDEASYPCVLPASLAACMRVDSCFVPTLVSMVQVLVTMPMMMIKFSNHIQHLGKGVPKKLHPFIFYDNEPEDQEWALLSLDSPAIMGSHWGGYASRTSLQFSCACQLDVVEYRYLTQQTVIQPFNLQGAITVLPDGEYQLTSVDCSIDDLVVRVGKGAIHTLHCTAEAWKQILNYPALTTNICDKVVFCHYIICNDTNCMIRFGQVGTNENHILKSREMYGYGWCSHKTSNQMLHLCVNGESWHWCDPFSIDHEGQIVRTINTGTHNITFIIKIKPLSNVQNQVIIRGQLLFSNRLSLPLEMKLVTNRRTDSELCMSLSPIDSEASLILDDGEVRYLRLRQIGVTSAWSQEVFICGDRMKDKRLVKIPVLDKSQLIHLWCQIFYQNHGTAIQKLIVFSPLFILKSHLPVPLYIAVDTPKLKYHQQVQVPSKGKAYQLHCQGGDIVHSLSFQMGESMQRSSPAMTISTGMIEQIDRTPLQNPVDIDHVLLDWRADLSTTGWPYIKFHEDISFDVPPTERISSASFDPLPLSLPKGEPSAPINSALTSLYQDSCSIDLDITISECWPGCCTILLDITPSCLLTNNTCTDFVLIAPSDQHWNVPKGATFTPTGIQEYFQLGLEIDGEVVTSGIIPLSEEEVAARRYRTDVGEVLYVDGYVHTAIFTKTIEGNRQAYFFTINSSIQHKIRIITVSERFTITNFSGSPYELQTICVPLGNGKAKLPTELTIVNLPSHNKSRYEDNLCPLLAWTLQLQTDQEDIELNEKTTFVHYIRLQEVSKEEPQHSNMASNESHWSFPLRLIANEQGTRLTTAVPVQLNSYATTQPLVISGHVQDGLTYFVLDTDKSPGCLISNCCPFPISYGQTLMNLTISDVTVLEETELLDCLPTVEPGHCAHYTMPFLNAIFPEIPNSQILPKLHVSACISEDDSQPNWNNGIDILSQHDTFVHMPHASDIKVHVERVNMTTYLILEPVSRADISAKEIRSRIKGKETKVLVKDKSASNSKKIAKKNSAFSSVFSLQKANIYETSKLKDVLCFNCGCMLKSVRFVILDETSSPNTFGEILGVSMSTVFIAHYPVTNFPSQMVQISKTSMAICIGDMQIDNQLFHQAQYDFPVVLIRQEGHAIPAASLPPIDNQMSAVEKHAILKSASFLHLQVVMETDVLSKKSSIMKALEISIQPLALFLEDAFIYRLLKELQAFIPTQLSVERLPSDNLKQIPSLIVQASDVINCPVRMQYLCIHPINTLLSVHASLKLFIASDHTPLSFGRFEKEEIFTSSYYLIRTMTMHYASGALVRAGIVVGSLEILGNPTGLIRNIGNGVADLFKLPFTGLTKGPGAFLAGVSQGMSSLLRNVTAGTLTSITNFASSVSRNMDRLSLDSGHLERQEESRRNRPAGLSDGLKQGLTGLGLSLLSAIAGIADQPIQGILSSQLVTDNSLATGFVAGVGKGLVGVVTKPIGGAAEFLSQTGQGILHGVGLTRAPEARFRPRLDAVHQGKNASIKYIFKTLLSVMPDAKLLLAIDVIQFDVTGFGSKVTLLLTPELLFTYDSDDDMSSQMFTLSELECLPANEDDDIGVLTFMWQDQNQQLIQQEQNPNKDRLTAFLDSASGYVPLPDFSSINQPPTGPGLAPVFNSPVHASDKATTPYFEFRVEPHFKEAFLMLFRMAKNKLIGRGFPL